MQTLFVGEPQHPDFATVRSGLSSVVEAKTPDAALAFPGNGAFQLLVLAQATRQQFCPSSAERLRAVNPQAAPVNLLSSLCEGEVRSGRPLPGWNRVLWYRWPAEYARFCSGDRAIWPSDPAGLPGDRFLQRALGSGSGGVCCQVGLIGRNAQRLATLRDVIGQMGHYVEVVDQAAMQTAIAETTINVAMLAGDSLDPWLRQTIDHVRRFRRIQRIVVLLNFPRRDEIEWLVRKCGTRLGVVAQPFELFELQYAIRGELAVADGALAGRRGRTAQSDRRTA